MSKARRVGDLLRVEDSALATLVLGVRRQDSLNKRFNELVDAPIAQHVRVACTDEGLLILIAQTSVWGHRIRYLAPTILEQLREIEPLLCEIKIIVRPTRSEPRDPIVAVRRASLGESSAALLAQIASTCTNPRLADILQRLSKVTRPPSSDD
jgi:hypothetical protein